MTPANPTSIVEPLANKLTSQEFIFAIIVILVSAGVFVLILKYGAKLLSGRDDAIKQLSSRIDALTSCMEKVISIQNVDHDATIRNRDLLHEQGVSISEIRQYSNLTFTCLKDLTKDLKEHAQQCLKQALSGQNK